MPALQTAQSHDCLARRIHQFIADNAATLAERSAFDAAAHVGLNIELFRQAGLLAVGIPVELGGDGASYSILSEMIRQVAHHCSSTSLVLAMHTHQIAILTRLSRHLERPRQLLKSVSANRLMLISSGGADWLTSSGTARPVPEGYVVNARKSFASGSEMGDILMTSAVDESAQFPTVVHFCVAMSNPAVQIDHTWSTLGMRGTGSHDVIIRDLFVSSDEILATRRSGCWAQANHLTALLAFPLIYASYLGIAESIRQRIIDQGLHRTPTTGNIAVLGEIDTRLHSARLAWEDMVTTASNAEPGFPASNRVMMGRQLVDQQVRMIADQALDYVGGRSFYNANGLEKLFRDLQAARFHPLQRRAQALLAGRCALGIDPGHIDAAHDE